MNTFEYIIFAVIMLLALVFIGRMIIKLVKGENPCLFCKSCGDDEEKPSCCVPDKNSDKQENKTKED